MLLIFLWPIPIKIAYLSFHRWRFSCWREWILSDGIEWGKKIEATLQDCCLFLDHTVFPFSLAACEMTTTDWKYMSADFSGCSVQFVYIYLHVCCKHVSWLFNSSFTQNLHNIRSFLKEVDTTLFDLASHPLCFEPISILCYGFPDSGPHWGLKWGKKTYETYVVWSMANSLALMGLPLYTFNSNMCHGYHRIFTFIIGWLPLMKHVNYKTTICVVCSSYFVIRIHALSPFYTLFCGDVRITFFLHSVHWLYMLCFCPAFLSACYHSFVHVLIDMVFFRIRIFRPVIADLGPRKWLQISNWSTER